MPRPTVYLTDGVGAVKTNDSQTVAAMQSLGYRICDHNEYSQAIRRMQDAERKAVAEEREEDARWKRYAPPGGGMR